MHSVASRWSSKHSGAGILVFAAAGIVGGEEIVGAVAGVAAGGQASLSLEPALRFATRARRDGVGVARIGAAVSGAADADSN